MIKSVIGSGILVFVLAVVFFLYKPSGFTPQVLLPVPLIAQSTDYSCGAAATQALLHYWGDSFSEQEVRQFAGTSPETGTAYQNILRLVIDLNSEEWRLKRIGSDSGQRYKITWHAVTERVPAQYGRSGNGCPEPATPDESYDRDILRFKSGDRLTATDLRHHLDAGRPILVLLQAWASDSKSAVAYADRWDSGHYVVVNGYDSGGFFMMDPSSYGAYRWLPDEEFLARWHDYDGWLDDNGGRCPGGDSLMHWGLIIDGRTPPDPSLGEISKLP